MDGGQQIDDPPQRIALLTDFGPGPYIGQMQLLLSAFAPSTATVSLCSDLPVFRPDLAAYLLSGFSVAMPPRTLYLCVVDPGVGSERDILLTRCGSDWWLAPDNGLLAPLLRIHPDAEVYRLDWRPQRLSASFHGRDLFVPATAALVAGVRPMSKRVTAETIVHADWPVDAWRICYIDGFGNLISGVRASKVSGQTHVAIGGRSLSRSRTFSEVDPGVAFWYENAFGLLEVAVNQGRADALLGVGLGTALSLVPADARV